MKDYRAYWDQNIDKWGDLYLQMSHGHEQLDAPRWLARLYAATVGRLEARLMRERYAITMRFIEENVGPGSVFADIGCGTGIFTVAALRRGAKVQAIDFSESSLRVTKENVARHASGEVSYLQIDPQAAPVPAADVALVMGVTPYVRDLAAFLGNVLPHTRRRLFCQYTDPRRVSNRVRRLIPALNVRNLIFHAPAEVDAIYAQLGWRMRERVPFATGFIDTAEPVA
jgi:SAM-dependent methyltransferase